MPEALAGVGVEGQQGIGVEIVAHAVAAVEIDDRGAGGGVDDAALGVERHAGPVVGRARGLPGIRRPGLVSGLAGTRNGVEAPANGAGAHVEGANIAGRRGMGFRVAPTDDDQVFVDDARGGERDGLLEVVAATILGEALAQIDAATLAKRRHGGSGARIEAVEKVHDAGEDALLAAVGPVGEAARWLRTGDSGVELPFELAGGGVEGDHLLRGGVGIKGAADDQRIVLQAALFAGIEAPCQGEPMDVAAIDLRQAGVVIAVGSAAIGRPANHTLRRTEAGQN